MMLEQLEREAAAERECVPPPQPKPSRRFPLLSTCRPRLNCWPL